MRDDNDDLRHLVGADLLSCVTSMATNQVSIDEVVSILSPHACRKKRHWQELTAQCTEIVWPKVKAHFEQDMSSDIASLTAENSISDVMRNLIQRDLIAQPYAILFPNMSPINSIGLFYGKFGKQAWYHMPESTGEPAAEIAAVTKKTLRQANRLESISTYCHLYEENKSFLNVLGLKNPEQMHAEKKIRELLDKGLKPSR